MAFYSGDPGRRGRQLAGDLALALWTVLWVVVARFVYVLISSLAAPARAIESAGAQYSDRLTSAAERTRDTALVGRKLSEVFGSISGPGEGSARAGAEAANAISTLALVISLLVGLAPIVMVAVPWLIHRALFVRRQNTVRRLLQQGASPSLFAMRAVVHQPEARIAAISPHPVEDIQAGDQGVISALARLEIRDAGAPWPAANGRPG